MCAGTGRVLQEGERAAAFTHCAAAFCENFGVFFNNPPHVLRDLASAGVCGPVHVLRYAKHFSSHLLGLFTQIA